MYEKVAKSSSLSHFLRPTDREGMKKGGRRDGKGRGRDGTSRRMDGNGKRRNRKGMKGKMKGEWKV